MDIFDNYSPIFLVTYVIVNEALFLVDDTFHGNFQKSW